MQTQAFVLTKTGKPAEAFSLSTITLPELSSKQVRICVEAFGLNYADVMARNGLYREAPPLPSVIGYEVVGIIEAAGSDVDPACVGQRVVAFCRFGGYAKHVITEAHAFAPIGDLDAASALALATQFVTAYYMVEYTANVRSGDRVLVHAAAGGVGTALIQLCKQKGALVCAKIGSRSKEAIVRELGADEVVCYNETDYAAAVKNWLGTETLDVSFNPVAGSTFKKDRSLLGTGGRLVLFGGSELSGKGGFFSGLRFVWKMGIVIPIGLMMGSRTLAGVNMLKVADHKPHILAACLQAVVRMALDKQVVPVIGGRFSQQEFTKAHAALESGTTIGKLSVFWDE